MKTEAFGRSLSVLCWILPAIPSVLSARPSPLWWVNLLTLKGQWGFCALPTAFGNPICRLSSSLCGPAGQRRNAIVSGRYSSLYLGFPLHSAFTHSHTELPLPLNPPVLNMFGQNWQPIQSGTIATDKGLLPLGEGLPSDH